MKRSKRNDRDDGSSVDEASSSKSRSKMKKHTKRLAKQLRPLFSTGNFCVHSQHKCLISRLPDSMTVPITPNFFANGRFGPLILDSIVDESNHHLPPGSKYIVRRVIDLKSIDDNLLEKLKHEVAIVRKLCHPNIMPILTANVAESSLFIAMPLAERGSCRYILEKHFTYGFKEKVIKHILTSVLSAVYYLHLNSVIHTRISSRNVLLSQHCHTYLTGFEYAIQAGHSSGIVHGLPQDVVEYLPWTAPEVLAQSTHGFSYPADIYSVGALGVELNNGIPPFTDPVEPLAPALVLLEKLKGFTPRLLDCSTLRDEECQPVDGKNLDMMVFKNRNLSSDFHLLVAACCRSNPAARPTAEQLLRSCPFTNPIDQKRNSGTGELESELPILKLPFEEREIDGSGASTGNASLVTNQITFETIEEESESQLSSHFHEGICLSKSSDAPIGQVNNFWAFD